MAEGHQLTFAAKAQMRSASLLAPLTVFAAVALGLVPLALFALANADGGISLFDGTVLAVLRFTLWQAFVSTVLSVIPGLFVARALARQAFPGRSLLISLFGIPMVLPVIVGVLGLASVFGQNGWLKGLLPL
jgi:thiamine transport system permease protein